MKKFLVEFSVEIEVDERLLASVLTDEWSERYYEFKNAEDVASHLALNMVRGYSLKQLDGFANQKPERAVCGDLEIRDVTETT